MVPTSSAGIHRWLSVQPRRRAAQPNASSIHIPPSRMPNAIRIQSGALTNPDSCASCRRARNSATACYFKRSGYNNKALREPRGAGRGTRSQLGRAVRAYPSLQNSTIYFWFPKHSPDGGSRLSTIFPTMHRQIFEPCISTRGVKVLAVPSGFMRPSRTGPVRGRPNSI